MVAQTHLDVKLYVHFLSCLFLLLLQTFSSSSLPLLPQFPSIFWKWYWAHMCVHKTCCLLKLLIVLTGLPAAPNGVPGRTHVFSVLWTGLVCQAGWLYCHQVPGWAHGNAMGLWTSLFIPDCSAFCHDGSDWRGAYIFIPSKRITHRKWGNHCCIKVDSSSIFESPETEF